MKNQRLLYYKIIVLLAIYLFSSCGDKIEIPGGPLSAYNKVYMPSAVNTADTINLKMADSIQSFVYGAYFGGYSYPTQDIKVDFEVSTALVDSFNLKHGSNYTLLPEGSYTLEKTSAIIPKGKLSSNPLHISINPLGKLVIFKEYLLPVSISKIDDGITLNQNLKTSYYIVKASLFFADYPDFDRTGWKVVGVSSEEPAEGLIYGGLGKCVIDSKILTYWQTKWSGGILPPPHWLIVDMGVSNLIHGLSFVNRQTTTVGKPNIVNVSISNNGVDWEEVGTLTLQNISTQQKYFLNLFRQARYFKITILSSFGNVQYANLAELGAF